MKQVLAYEEWEQTVPEEIKSDSVWRMQAYRLALYAADIGWEDVVLLARDRKTIGILLTKIIRLLLTMIPQRRSVTLHDEGGEYGGVRHP